MIKLFASVYIEASAEVVWAQLAKLEDIQLWSEAVIQARCEGPIAQGVGAERTCELVGNRTIQGVESLVCGLTRRKIVIGK